jgi:hypothetical protein
VKQHRLERGYSIFAAILCAALLPQAAGAGVLFDNLAFGNSLNSFSVSATNWAAQSFTTDANNNQLTSVVVALEGIASAGNVTVSLYSSTAGSPGSPNASVLSLGTILQSALSTSSFTNQTVSGNNFALTPNTRYFVVVAGSSSVSPDALWERENGSANGVGISGQTRAESSNSGSTWSPHAINSDFQPYIMQVNVNGVPEPNTVFGVVAGLTALVAARFRRRRR